MRIITYIENGVKTKHYANYDNAYVEWEGRRIYGRHYPNIFEALSGPYPTSHHFDHRVVPIQGVQLMRIDDVQS